MMYTSTRGHGTSLEQQVHRVLCRGSFENSRNKHTHQYGDKCVWEWKRREVHMQIDARKRMDHKNGNVEGDGP